MEAWDVSPIGSVGTTPLGHRVDGTGKQAIGQDSPWWYPIYVMLFILVRILWFI